MLSKKRFTTEEVEEHSPYYTTVNFEETFEGEPGQFAMVQIPGKGEKPMSLSSRNSITVEEVGEFTGALSQLQEEDTVYVREPLGQGFDQGEYLAVAGGCGIAPLAYLAEEDMTGKILYGARDKEHLILDKFQKDVEYATDDGSYGHEGFVTELITEELVKEFEKFAVCGPEIMMKNTAEELEERGAEADNIYLSLERYMKCGVGLCGSCECSGKMVCVDGPVFPYDEVKEMDDFGERRRTKSGKKVSIGQGTSGKT